MDNLNLNIRNENDFIPYSFFRDSHLRFNPLVFEQRYFAVLRLLENAAWADKIKKVVDFGCAELKFFNILKTCKSIEHIVCVDNNECVLKIHGGKVAPLLCDYLTPRHTPLMVEVYCGSVDTANDCLRNTDAVIGIELIEHLYPNELDNLPYNLFSFIKPKLIILTTPNYEFNVLFKDKTEKFRHDDHKFEWTRVQFEDWANNLCLRYSDYTVKFFGIGVGPEGTEEFGCCTQLAIFIRQDIIVKPKKSKKKKKKENAHILGEYKLLSTHIYPVYVDDRTRDERILDELKFHIRRFMNMDEYYNDTKFQWEIPFDDVSDAIITITETNADFRRVLLSNSYEINEANIIIIKEESDDEVNADYNREVFDLDIAEDK